MNSGIIKFTKYYILHLLSYKLKMYDYHVNNFEKSSSNDACFLKDFFI